MQSNKLGHLVEANPESLPENTDPNYEFEYVEISDVQAGIGITKSAVTSFGKAPSRARRKVQEGDVIISTVRTYLKAVAHIDAEHAECIVSTGFAVLRPKQNAIHSKFLSYMISSSEILDEVARLSTGISYPAISTGKLLSIQLNKTPPPPPLLSQEQIAAFLDRETGKIDATIRELEQTSALLQEKWQAMISETVAKGLPSSVKMVKLSAVLESIRSGEASSSDRLLEGDYPIYGATGEIGRTNNAPYKGPILLVGRVGSIGALNLIESGQFWASDNTLLLTANNKILPKFLLYALKSFDFNNIKSGMGQPLITGGALKQQKILLPSLEKQAQIISQLDRQLAELDAGVAESEQVAALLKEKRQALISEAVTGAETTGGGGGASQAEYRYSGVDWIGDIPAHWQITLFKHLFKESAEINGVKPVGPMLAVSGLRGVEVKKYADNNQKRTDDQLENYRVVRPGQLAVNTMWLNHTGLGVSNYEGHMSPAYRAYGVSDKMEGRYVHYLLRSELYVNAYIPLLKGVRPNSLQMSTQDLKDFPVVVPPREEQEEIARYLDLKQKAHELRLESVQETVSLLKEKRQALISEAVTGQLDIDAYESAIS